MFYDCLELTNLTLGENFNNSNVTTMHCMFYGCSSLTTLDLSSFDTSNVTSMRSMFNGCSSLTSLDLSSFNTSNVTTMVYMFKDCASLTTIYVDASLWSTGSITEEIYDEENSIETPGSIDMFTGCTSLVGGNGTSYNYSDTDPNYTNKTYACVDDPDNGNPGYLTDIADKPSE